MGIEIGKGSRLHIVLELVFGVSPQVDQKSRVVLLHHARVDFVFLGVPYETMRRRQNPTFGDKRSPAQVVETSIGFIHGGHYKTRISPSINAKISKF